MKHPLCVLLGALAAWSLCGTGTVLPQSVPVTVVGPGWQCLLIPSSFDGPGTLFSVNATGEKSRIVDLRALNLIPVTTGTAAVGRLASKSTIGADIVIGLLERAIPGLGLKLKAEGDSISTVAVEYSNVKEETTYESEVNEIFDEWFSEHVKPKPGLRYFFVRDAYVAGSISYDLTSSSDAGAGGEVSLKRIFEASTTLFKRENQNTYRIDQTFDPPLRVCIRASEVLVSRSGEGSEAYRLTPRTGQVPPIARSLD
jgi:hypothetical protein